MTSNSNNSTNNSHSQLVIIVLTVLRSRFLNGKIHSCSLHYVVAQNFKMQFQELGCSRSTELTSEIQTQIQ